MEHAHEALEATLASLSRLETERKLRTIPAALLESAWAGEAQTEAVVDALLIFATAGNDRAYLRARNIGEWAARIAAAAGMDPGLMRRCGVLANVPHAVLERVRETRDCAPIVRDVQQSIDSDASRVIRTAADFDALIANAEQEERYLPSDALRMMLRACDAGMRPVVQTLQRVVRSAPASAFDTVA